MSKRPCPKEWGGAQEKIRAEKATPQRAGRGAGAGKGEKSHAPKNEMGRRSGKRREKPRPKERGGALEKIRAKKATHPRAVRGTEARKGDI